MEKYQKVRYEFLVFNTNTTINLEKPLSVTFMNLTTESNPNFGDVNINRYIFLTPYWRSLGSSQSVPLGVAQYGFPYIIKLENNKNEIDVTQYTIQFRGTSVGNRLVVIVKYLVD